MAMNYSNAAVELVKSFEGCRLTAYPDPATKGPPWSIGYGRARGIKKGDRWTVAQCEKGLLDDLTDTAILVTDAIAGKPTTQNELDALVSLTYNIGIANLRSSTLLKLHKAGDKAGAAAQFLRWNKAGNPLKVMDGLTRRRAAEAALYVDIRA